MLQLTHRAESCTGLIFKTRSRDVQYRTRPATHTYCQLVPQPDPTRRHKIRNPTQTRIYMSSENVQLLTHAVAYLSQKAWDVGYFLHDTKSLPDVGFCS